MGGCSGSGNIPLWCYQCTASFGRSLPGIPDTYPHLIASYKKSSHLFRYVSENHNMTHTFGIWMFIFFCAWHIIHRVISKKNYLGLFQCLLSSAAGEVQAFFQSLETNWNAIDKLIRNDDYETGSLGVSIKNKKQTAPEACVESGLYTNRDRYLICLIQY
ncbi:MAG: hypothetical protein V8T87_15385 [Victivallales bacterium]